MKPSAASHSLPDLVQMAHLRKAAGAYMLACSTFLAAATLASWAEKADLETQLLQDAWACHALAMEREA